MTWYGRARSDSVALGYLASAITVLPIVLRINLDVLPGVVKPGDPRITKYCQSKSTFFHRLCGPIQVALSDRANHKQHIHTQLGGSRFEKSKH